MLFIFLLYLLHSSQLQQKPNFSPVQQKPNFSPDFGESVLLPKHAPVAHRVILGLSGLVTSKWKQPTPTLPEEPPSTTDQLKETNKDCDSTENKEIDRESRVA